MNFLAHCLLADGSAGRTTNVDEPPSRQAWRAGFLAGGILGDFVKGPIPDSLPVELRAGIRLHRRVDSHSNQLPEMKASVRRFAPDLRRVAPVLLDIVADHCLARSWPRYASEPLDAFIHRVHAAIAEFDAMVPARGRTFIERMVESNLLLRYADPAVARRAMEHVLDRLRLPHLGGALQGVLADDIGTLAADFDIYFPLLQGLAGRERVAAAQWATDPTRRS